MKEHSLKGVKTHEIKIIPDERGFFAEALRQDWKEFLGAEQITQANLSYSYPNVVRAWHKHSDRCIKPIPKSNSSVIFWQPFFFLPYVPN